MPDKFGWDNNFGNNPAPTRHARIKALAPGCCSSILPCAHQRGDPTTICGTCQRSRLYTLEEVDAERKRRRALSSEQCQPKGDER